MTKAIWVLAVLVLLPLAALADYGHENDFKPDKEDHFKKGITLKVWRVLGENEVIASGQSFTRSTVRTGKQVVPGPAVESMTIAPFILRTPTKGLVTGSKFNPSGKYKVVDTKTVGRKTYYVLEKTE